MVGRRLWLQGHGSSFGGFSGRAGKTARGWRQIVSGPIPSGQSGPGWRPLLWQRRPPPAGNGRVGRRLQAPVPLTGALAAGRRKPSPTSQPSAARVSSSDAGNSASVWRTLPAVEAVRNSSGRGIRPNRCAGRWRPGRTAPSAGDDPVAPEHPGAFHPDPRRRDEAGIRFERRRRLRRRRRRGIGAARRAARRNGISSA